MKINMWKLLLAGLFASAALAGCEDNRNNFMVDDTISFVNEEQYAGVSVYNGKYELAILKNGKGQQSAKALLSVSETALAEYNTANGTNYAVLPANCYKLSSSTVGFSDGDTRKFVEVTWDDAAIFALGEGTEYAIPLELTVANDALAVDANRNVKIINPKRASIGMERELAASFHPTATHEVISFDGDIVLDNAISTMDLTVNYTIDNSLVDAYNQANGTNYLAAPDCGQVLGQDQFRQALYGQQPRHRGRPARAGTHHLHVAGRDHRHDRGHVCPLYDGQGSQGPVDCPGR